MKTGYSKVKKKRRDACDTLQRKKRTFQATSLRNYFCTALFTKLGTFITTHQTLSGIQRLDLNRKMRRCSKSSEGKDFRTSRNISSSTNHDELKENRLCTLQDLRQIPERPGSPPVAKGSRCRARRQQRLRPPAAPRSDRSGTGTSVKPGCAPLTRDGTGRGGSAAPPPAAPRGAGSGSPGFVRRRSRVPAAGAIPAFHPAARLFNFILSAGGRGSVEAQSAGEGAGEAHGEPGLPVCD